MKTKDSVSRACKKYREKPEVKERDKLRKREYYQKVKDEHDLMSILIADEIKTETRGRPRTKVKICDNCGCIYY